jgi:ABC-type Zn2+ transport system substrate-binding protein/surface adhesin
MQEGEEALPMLEEEDHQDQEAEEDRQVEDLQEPQEEAQEEHNHNKPTKETANHLELSLPSLRETAQKLRAFCVK